MKRKRKIFTSDQKAAELYRNFVTCNDLDRMRRIDNYITTELLYPSPFSISWIDGRPDITWANPKFEPIKLENHGS